MHRTPVEPSGSQFAEFLDHGTAIDYALSFSTTIMLCSSGMNVIRH